MEPRLDLFKNPVISKMIKHVVAAGNAAEGSGVPTDTLHLFMIRASQINGCSGCLDMHVKDAAAAGETPVRLALVAAWREANVFT